MDIIKAIQSKYSTLRDSGKAKVSTYVQLLAGDRLGELGYVPIDGVDLGGLEKRMVKSGDLGNEGEYLDLVIDAIQIVDGAGHSRETYMCSPDGVNLGHLMGVNAVQKGREGVLQDWYDGGDTEEKVEGYKGERVGDIDYGTGKEKDEEGEKVSKADTSDGRDTREDRKKDDEDAEDADKKPSKKDNYAGLREEVRRVFNSTIIQNIDAVLRRYSMLYESGYDLERPYGFISSQGVVYVDSENVLKIRDDYRSDIDLNASVKLYDYFESKVDFIESDTRSMKGIAEDMLEGYKEGKILYFPYKMIEYAYGRDSSSSESKEYRYAKYKGEGISTKWGKMREKIREDVKLLIENCVVIYCVNVLGCSKNGGIEERKKILSQNDAINGYIKYITSSLSTSVIMTDYKSVESKPVKMRLRCCDPNGHCYEGMINDILTVAFAGNSGGSDGVSLNSSLDPQNSKTYLVYEYAHEFDHVLSNAMPLFAYRAYEALREKGESISFKDLVLGQSIDGTILRNGTHGVNLKGNLFHYINAGSRSGKGVMTLNMIAGALLSGKAIFYLDNKPDMASMLSQLGGGNTDKGPSFFALNGSNYNDDKQAQFTMEDSWINKEHIPIEAVSLFGEPSWSKLGDLFYMRAYTLAFGIIMARGLEGGRGKGSDERFGGEQGIFLVCDETNILQDKFRMLMEIVADKIPLQSKNFKSMSLSLKAKYEEVNSGDARKGAGIKYDSMRRDFEEAFNGSKFYALSILNMFADNISYLGDKSNAGFRREEFEKSDVAVIGQNLEQKPISKETIRTSVSSARLTGETSGGKGLGATQVAKDVKGAASIPLAHFVFSSSDALIGYNSIHPEYLAQTEQGSNAFGRLDLSANNFCYLPRLNLIEDEKPADQLTKSKANDTSSVYFKPYLILNDSSSEYTSQMYSRVGGAGISREEVIREYPNSDGSDISPYVGFPEYMGLMGVSDIVERLQKSADIANYVTGEVLGYQDDGSGRPLWLQLVTDLRPEWVFSLKDVACMSGGMFGDANLPKGKDSPLVKEYYDYAEFYETVGRDMGIIDNTLTRDGSVYVDDSGDINWDTTGYDNKGDEDVEDDCYDSDYDNEGYRQEMRRCFDDDVVMEEDEEFDDIFGEDTDLGDSEGDWEAEDSSTVLNPDDIFSKGGNVYGEYEGRNSGYGSDGGEGEGNDGVDVNVSDVLNEDIPYEDYDLSNSEGVDCGYSVGDEDSKDTYGESEMGNVGAGLNSNDDGIKAQSLAQLIGIVTGKVIKAYGGLERIKSIRVLGGGLVVNGVIYRCKVSKGTIGLLPLDIRRKIASGNLADLFNYREMLNMRNLRGIEFDSKSFLSSVVCEEMGYHGTLGIDYFFRDIPSLQMLVVGKNKFTRQNYKEEIKKDEDFYYTSQGTVYASACDKVLGRWTKNSWSFTRNMLTDRNRGIFTRVLGVVFGGAATVVVGVADAGAKGVKGVSSAIDRRRKGGRVRRGLKGFKNSFDDLF